MSKERHLQEQFWKKIKKNSGDWMKKKGGGCWCIVEGVQVIKTIQGWNDVMCNTFKIIGWFGRSELKIMIPSVRHISDVVGFVQCTQNP